MEATHTFNPLQTYQADEVAKLLNCGHVKVRELEKQGLIKGIKIGRATIFSFWAIERFLNTYEGEDISNMKLAMDAKERKETK